MAINIINATLQMRHGLEQDFDSDQMTVGEWAISTDSKYVRMCFLPGIVIRMATYEGFEKDMIEIQKILKECQDIKLAVETMADLAEQHKNDSASSALLSESWAHGNTGVRVGESTNNSEYYSNQSKNEADRAKNEADRAASIVGIDIDSELSEISTNPVQNKVVTKHLENKVSIDGDSSSTTVTFEAATQRAGIESGDSLAVAFGKLAKFCSDLDPHAFNPLANNLTTNTSGYGMDARQGPVIDKKISDVKTEVSELNTNMFVTGAFSGNWLPGFFINGMGFTVIIPKHSKKHTLTITSARIFTLEGGWVDTAISTIADMPNCWRVILETDAAMKLTSGYAYIADLAGQIK